MKSVQHRNTVSADSSQSSFFQRKGITNFADGNHKSFFNPAKIQTKSSENKTKDSNEQQLANVGDKTMLQAPSSFLFRAPLSKQEQADEKDVREKMQKAISLLNKSTANIAPGGQEELLDAMLDTFNQVTPDHIGILDANRGRIKLGMPVKLFYTFKNPGEMSRPFEYSVRFDLSHETEGEADGYFSKTGNYGGIIVAKVVRVKPASVASMAELLVHEAVHMFSHLQRAVTERIGSTEATMVPGKQAAGILDASAFDTFKKTFAAHFSDVRDFLNRQTHRNDAFQKLPESIIEDWTRKVVEESIAYVYESRVGLAIDRVRTAGTKGPVVNIAGGFEPVSFLKNYMTRHWLTDPDDQKAMATKDGQGLLASMSTDIRSLHQSIETQVGPDK